MATRSASGIASNQDDFDDSVWDSPDKSAQKPQKQNTMTGGVNTMSARRPTHAEQEARNAGLRDELANVRKVNEAIEGVTQSLERAKSNMRTVNQTVGAASSLLNTWTRILSQTEHNQRLILDPSWQGTSQDLADMEADAFAKQQAAQRRDVEEQERRNAAASRAAEEEERRKAGEVTKPAKSSTRGRARGSGRASATQPGYVAMGGSANTSTTSIGRGSNTTRRTTSGIGRARGGRTRP